MVVRWTLFDPDLATTWTFPLNPKEGAIPALAKKITSQVTLSPAGKVLLFEGRDDPQTIGFTGTILTQAHYQGMVDWFAKRRQLKLTDDLGQQFWVYLTKFTPKRVNRHSHPWAMTYDAECLIVDWA